MSIENLDTGEDKMLSAYSERFVIGQVTFVAEFHLNIPPSVFQRLVVSLFEEENPIRFSKEFAGPLPKDTMDELARWLDAQLSPAISDKHMASALFVPMMTDALLKLDHTSGRLLLSTKHRRMLEQNLATSCSSISLSPPR